MGSARDASRRDPTVARRLENLELTSTPEPDAAGGTRSSPLAHVRALPRWEQVAVALVAPALVVLCFVRFGLTGRAAVDAVFAAALVVLTAIDIHRRLLPNVIVLPTLAFVLIAQIALFPGRTVEWLVACAGAALFFFVPLLFYPTGMGMGDVKLAALLGAALGKSVVAAIVAGVLAGAGVALVILVREGRGARKKAIAFGPFLAIGGLIALFLGGR